MSRINKRFVHFNHKSDFEARLAAGDIQSSSIVFIRDANEIWTHDTYYVSGGKQFTVEKKNSISECTEPGDYVVPTPSEGGPALEGPVLLDDYGYLRVRSYRNPTDTPNPVIPIYVLLKELTVRVGGAIFRYVSYATSTNPVTWVKTYPQATSEIKRILLDSLDSYTQTGKYYVGDSGVVPTPYGEGFILEVEVTEWGHIFQTLKGFQRGSKNTAYPDFDGIRILMYMRVYHGGVWSDWKTIKIDNGDSLPTATPSEPEPSIPEPSPEPSPTPSPV